MNPMEGIRVAREKIDLIDEEIIQKLAERMGYAGAIGNQEKCRDKYKGLRKGVPYNRKHRIEGTQPEYGHSYTEDIPGHHGRDAEF